MNNNLPSGSIAQAVEILKKEEVIAYPTEAVFGVGCDPDSEVAVNRLLALKQRPVEKGLILIAANYEQLKPYIDDSMLTPAQRETIFSAWPGPVTFVFPAQPTTPRWLTSAALSAVQEKQTSRDQATQRKWFPAVQVSAWNHQYKA